MHILFLAPDTHAYNHSFLQGLKSLGARVSAVGPGSVEQLSKGARGVLDAYRSCRNVLDADELLMHARALAADEPFSQIETIDEPLVEAAAALREALGVPGLSTATARLCRDKVAMKEFLRARGVPCAASTGVHSMAELVEFAAVEGFPLIVKPVDGFNANDTHRVDDMAALQALAPKLGLDGHRRLAVEEFIEGHEGFYDTIVGPEGVRHDFVGHYYPGCLEANRTRWISPQIAISNRIEDDIYRELRAVAGLVTDALGLRGTATHMEWFMGPKGLRFGEIGARPAGEKIWDMYRRANDFDVFREWALAVLGLPSEERPSRRLCAGSIQIRPDKDGIIAGHTGVRAAFARYGSYIYEYALPEEGAPTQGLDRGWLCNTWFRLEHPSFDELRGAMSAIGEGVKTRTK
ncbi:argininosuccinate lyase [Planctomycetes bacterium Poly30]|uniref:Argininosuccinate lyase n=1 Tax=Saltatorellus ferox TaxID=2528018 RepID=A0A518EZN0_9BACT|nr:argininosuccinate lyase [Planctomycetes bacterium Poly30]